MKPIRNILFLQATDGMFSYRRQAGAQHIAVANGWMMHTVRYSMLRNGEYRLHRPRGARRIADLVAHWQLDGAILEYGDSGPQIDRYAFGGMPVVFIDTDAAPNGSEKDLVFTDQASFAQQAARELLKSGFDNYAFVPSVKEEPWNRKRGDAFKAEIARHARRFHSFHFPDAAVRQSALASLFAPWIDELPKPVGVFAVNDLSARAVADACARLGLKVPEDVAIVGVDNDCTYFASDSPTLTSIPQNSEGEGATAAGLLAEKMDAPGRVFPPRRCAAAHVVSRESTHFDSWRDIRVAKGLEFIRQGACGGIGPADVARAMGASRTLADASFRKALGHTILDEIHEVRIHTAQDMLERGVQPDIVALNCGYSSVNDFRRVFKRRTGRTIRRWLKEK